MMRMLKLIANKIDEIIVAIFEYEYEDVLDRKINKK